MNHVLWVKSHILPLYREDRKSLEIRLNDSRVCDIQVNDTVTFNKCVVRRVVAIRHYASFEEMLAAEDAEQIYPSASKENILQFLKSVYRQSRIEECGVVVLEFFRNNGKTDI